MPSGGARWIRSHVQGGGARSQEEVLREGQRTESDNGHVGRRGWTVKANAAPVKDVHGRCPAKNCHAVAMDESFSESNRPSRVATMPDSRG